MTTSSDHLAILLTHTIESKELSFRDRSFALAKELKFRSKTNWYFVAAAAAAAAGCEYGMDSIKDQEHKTFKAKVNHIFSRTKKPYEVERLVVVVVVVVVEEGSLLYIINGLGVRN